MTAPNSLNFLRFEGRLIVVGNAAQDGDQAVGTNTFWFVPEDELSDSFTGAKPL